ncbi:MAG: Hpt domain-containing protein [Bacilli bacterium]
MTLEECYIKFGGDYKLVLSRLMMDKMVDRFIRKFLDDQSYNLLITSLNEKNYEEAFRAAHTLKGLCLNLCLDGLLKPVVELTEKLRGGVGPAPQELIDETTYQYERTCSAIKEYINQ